VYDATRTTTALLAGLHDLTNEAAWRSFDARYRPILMGFLRRLGLSDADAQDAAQETLVEFLRAYRSGRYERDRGRLRSWLLAIARTHAALKHRKAARHPTTPLEFDLQDEATLTQIWMEERRHAILRAALDELRASTRTGEQTIQAFELLVIRQHSVASVAEALGMSAHDVYLAKSRVAARLRTIVTSLERLHDGEE